jgi:hypothetical protein
MIEKLVQYDVKERLTTVWTAAMFTPTLPLPYVYSSRKLQLPKVLQWSLYTQVIKDT